MNLLKNSLLYVYCFNCILMIYYCILYWFVSCSQNQSVDSCNGWVVKKKKLDITIIVCMKLWLMQLISVYFQSLIIYFGAHKQFYSDLSISTCWHLNAGLAAQTKHVPTVKRVKLSLQFEGIAEVINFSFIFFTQNVYTGTFCDPRVRSLNYD